MRKGIAGVLLVFCCVGLVFADASFEVISQDIDNNGNIRVWTSHSVDGVEIESVYPKIKDRYVWATRYSKQNFAECKDKVEIEQKILDDIKNFSDTLIRKEFDKNAPKTINQIRIDYNAQANTDFMTSNLDKLVGKTVSTLETLHKIDTDNNGLLDKDIILKSDGTKTELAIEEVIADIAL